MLIHDQFVFLELQKTGSTHIKRTLERLFGGENRGKHNVPPPDLVRSGRAFIGSVRDPWGWYLSLWSYGCQRRGALYGRLTDPETWDPLRPVLDAAPAGSLAVPGDRLNARRAHDVWYADMGDGEAFREWLRAVCMPELREACEPGFGDSPIGALGCGLMTYRYLWLFCQTDRTAPPAFDSLEALKVWADAHFLPRYMVRQRQLADDLLAALDGLGLAVSDADREALRKARPTNISSRPHPFSHYYDASCLDLVAQRERYLIERYRFACPVIG